MTMNSTRNTVSLFNNISLFYQNCRGLNLKLNDLLSNICSYPLILDIICLSETWLTNATPCNAGFPPNFSVVRSDRDLASTGFETGGGVLTAINNKLKFRRRTDLEYSGCGEICSIEVFLDNCSIIIGNHYFHPRTDVTDFALYCSFIKEHLLNIENLILVGDFKVPGVKWDSLDITNINQ